MTSYDVIVVGGRVAGASLAARLGAQGVRVLLLERDTFPKAHPASSPVIYAPAMALLDAIGVPEAAYAATPLRRWVVEGVGVFVTSIDVPADAHGRDYAYAVDRATLDAAVWAAAAAHPSVTVCQGASVVGLLRAKDGRVVGVRWRPGPGAPLQEAHAGVVVGADGRFSLVARAVGAAEHDVHTAHPTTLYYAYWRGVAALPGGPAMHLSSSGSGVGTLVCESADGTAMVTLEGRADKLDPPPGDAAGFYDRLARAHPSLGPRLRDATRVTQVRGMKRVGNLYRDAYGPGWALVGDALHQKDPLDGQGIYDALHTARLLSEALLTWHSGQAAWEAALARYPAQVRATTQHMYRSTLGRVFRELIVPWPRWALGTLPRWTYEDREYRARWRMVFLRAWDHARWLTPGLIIRVVLRGLARDARRALGTLMGARHPSHEYTGGTPSASAPAATGGAHAALPGPEPVGPHESDNTPHA